MQDQITMVKEFMQLFNQAINKSPRNLSPQEYMMRFKIQDEENTEYLEACASSDLVGIADALGDELYVLLGTILRHGMQDVIEKVFVEIHRSNLSKLDADGKPRYREDGKVLKGQRYFKPDRNAILIAHHTKD